MGIAAYNRGSRGISRDADKAMPAAIIRADRQAHKDQAERLQAQIDKLERDLSRARRCIAELRRSKEARMSEAHADLARADMAVSHLCRIAFPDDRAVAAGDFIFHEGDKQTNSACGCDEAGAKRHRCQKTTRDHVCVCICHRSTP